MVFREQTSATSSSALDAAAVLGQVYCELPGTIDAAPHKRQAERRRMLKSAAVRQDEIASDGPIYITALRVDVDAADGATAWERAGVPTPNLIVENPANGHAHLWWLLAIPVRRDNPRGMDFFRDVRRDLTAAIPGGDPAFAGIDMTHSPWSARFRTTVLTAQRYTLIEIRTALPRVERPAPRRAASPIPTHSRNEFVFRTGLRWAHTRRRRSGWDSDAEHELADIMAAAAREARATIANDGPYFDYEITASVRSVARYMRNNRAADIVVQHPALRRVLERDRKRRLRGSKPREEYLATANSRRADVARLRAAGVSVVAIAREIGCSRSEIYRLQRSIASPSVQGCPALQESILTRDDRETETALARVREIAADSFRAVEVLLEPGESIREVAWLTDGRVTVGGLPPRYLRIRAALLEVEYEERCRRDRRVRRHALAGRPSPADSPPARSPVPELLDYVSRVIGFAAVHRPVAPLVRPGRLRLELDGSVGKVTLHDSEHRRPH